MTDARTVPDIVVSLYGKHEKNLKHGERSAVFKDSTFNWMLSATIGSVDFSNAEAESTDAATLKTGGFFYKGDLSLTERFSLTDDSRLSLQFLSYSQLSSKNLDPSQQLVIGGPESVPAYASGIFNGSQGSYEMVTLDDVLWSNSRGDSFFSMGPLYAFGYVDVDRFYVPSTTSNNSAIMEGPGVEATLRVGRLTGAVSMAVPVGAIPDIVSNSIPGAFNFNAAGSAPIQVWGRLSYVF